MKRFKFYFSKFKLAERYKKAFLTGISTGLVKVFTGVINLITVPLTLNYLGNVRYGLWMSISSIISLMSFADLGLGNGLLNQISKAKGKNSISEAKIAVASTFFMLTALSITLLIIFYFVAPFVNWNKLLNTTFQDNTNETYITVFVIFTIFIINIPIGVVQRVQEGYQEGYIFQYWLIFGSVFSLISLLVSIHYHAGLPFLVAAFSSGQIVATILNGIQLFFFKRPELLPKFKNFNLGESKNLLKNGLTFLILGLCALIANSSDNIIISHLSGLKYVAGYEIVRKLFFFSMITAFFITPLWPAFAEAISIGDSKWVEKTRNSAIKISILSGLLITTPLLLFGKQIITIWVNKDYEPSWSLLFGFFVYIILNNYIGVMSTMLNSGNYARKQIIPLFITCILSVLFKYFLGKTFGVAGIIWGTTLSWLLGFCIPAYIISNNLINDLKNKK